MHVLLTLLYVIVTLAIPLQLLHFLYAQLHHLNLPHQVLHPRVVSVPELLVFLCAQHEDAQILFQPGCLGGHCADVELNGHPGQSICAVEEFGIGSCGDDGAI